MQFAQAGDSGNAASYERNPQSTFAFVIPGDEELFVGGGALNGSVGKLLKDEARQDIAFQTDKDGNYRPEKDSDTGREVHKFEKALCPYSQMHKKLFRRASLPSAVGTVVDALPAELASANVEHAACRVHTLRKHAFGALFISTFRRDRRPFDHPHNKALIYAVGPLGRNKKAEGEGSTDAAREALVFERTGDFLAELYNMGTSLVTLVTEFNRRHPLDEVRTVRLPIISGGTFIHPEVSPKEAALALLLGVRSALVALRPGLLIELMPSTHMKEAHTCLIKGSGFPTVSTLSAAPSISYLTDVEGHWEYFCNYLAHSKKPARLAGSMDRYRRHRHRARGRQQLLRLRGGCER